MNLTDVELNKKIEETKDSPEQEVYKLELQNRGLTKYAEQQKKRLEELSPEEKRTERAEKKRKWSTGTRSDGSSRPFQRTNTREKKKEEKTQSQPLAPEGTPIVAPASEASSSEPATNEMLVK